jgi:ABC-type sulfate transport system permease component
MAENNTTLIIMMVITIVLLFVAMVLSSMASSAASSCTCPDGDDSAHRYSMYTAVVCGLAALAVGAALGLYIYRDEVSSGVGKFLSGTGKKLQGKVE